MKITQINEKALVENDVVYVWVEVEVNGEYGCSYGSTVEEATVEALCYLGMEFDQAFDLHSNIIKAFKA